MKNKVRKEAKKESQTNKVKIKSEYQIDKERNGERPTSIIRKT